MKFTKEEMDHLLVLSKKDEVVLKAMDLINSFFSDPSKRFYYELCQTVDALSNELSEIREGQKTAIIGGDDKVFERVYKLMVDSEKIFLGIRIGAAQVAPNANKEKEMEDMSISDRRAASKEKK